MFKHHGLACSFCGKNAAEVSKLVAGPNVYICDACVAIASRIMSDPSVPESIQPQIAPSIWRRIKGFFTHRGSVRSESSASCVAAGTVLQP